MRQFVTSPSVVGSLPMSFVPGFDCTKTSGENMGELWQLHALTICPRECHKHLQYLQAAAKELRGV